MIIRKIEVDDIDIEVSDGRDALADKDSVSLVFTVGDQAPFEIYLSNLEWDDLSRAVGQYFEDRARE